MGGWVRERLKGRLYWKWKHAREALCEEENVSLSVRVVVALSAKQQGCFGNSGRIDRLLTKNVNCRYNLPASLFTLGIKLRNTTSNFIPGFTHHPSQRDIYWLVRCPFSLPLYLSPSVLPLMDNVLWRAEVVEMTPVSHALEIYCIYL